MSGLPHFTDDDVSAVLDAQAAQAVLHEAFVCFGRGEAAVQQRERTETGGVKLSTLGAVMPGLGVVGAKVYTTIRGRFGFVVILFSSEDGHPLATFDAGALTRIRTAACSVLAARAAGGENRRVLGLFGLGVQGLEHALQMAQAFPLERLYVHEQHLDEARLAHLREGLACPVEVTDADTVASSADLIVTATRAREPVFRGELLRDDAFVAAIGSSLPTTRELDDTALARATRVIVEWAPQALAEAGDLVLAAPGAAVRAKLVELSRLLMQPAPAGSGIQIYKAVGIGLADIAVAQLAYRRLTGHD